MLIYCINVVIILFISYITSYLLRFLLFLPVFLHILAVVASSCIQSPNIRFFGSLSDTCHSRTRALPGNREYNNAVQVFAK